MPSRWGKRRLHDPAIVQPIEPFAALFWAATRRRRLGLWDLEVPAPEADPFLFALPRDHPECLACACFPLCEGYGAWAGGCETWRAVIADLVAAAREISRLRGPAASGGRPPGAQSPDSPGAGGPPGPHPGGPR